MGRAKIPRKSTNIDMTAMCDVAFLLLSFFILATKQKPPEAVTVAAPSSVSTKAAPEKSILITLTKEGKTFLMMGDDIKKKDIIAAVNTAKSLGLSDAEVTKISKMPVIGVSLGQLKPLANRADEFSAAQMPGIPAKDSTNNELVDWIRGITTAYAGSELSLNDLQQMILLKGDGDALYPDFKNVKYALKKNGLYKFRIVTNSENAPVGSELYKLNRENPAGKKE
ncbi:MAG TPA: biopolymer transporter ExbD [Ferruginibacter sp.]|nr:biopolymer transporter ExbD [Ferruginibacter sp.]HPH92466.1 biopolymer transporter ExbD [Ferruginibacter sp.]